MKGIGKRLIATLCALAITIQCLPAGAAGAQEKVPEAPMDPVTEEQKILQVRRPSSGRKRSCGNGA